MIQCSKCNKYFEKGEPGSRSSQCQECCRAYDKTYRQANWQKHKAKVKRWTNKHRERIKAYIREYLMQNPCVDCGEQDIVVLEFDHREHDMKAFTIGGTAKNQYRSWDSIVREIAKCDVRCCNCHRRKTYAERGFTHRD